MPRLVVVHPSHDEDENCISSAGRKQRGSFNSLLLLEAHELSLREDPLEAEMERRLEVGGEGRRGRGMEWCASRTRFG